MVWLSREIDCCNGSSANVVLAVVVIVTGLRGMTAFAVRGACWGEARPGLAMFVLIGLASLFLLLALATLTSVGLTSLGSKVFDSTGLGSTVLGSTGLGLATFLAEDRRLLLGE